MAERKPIRDWYDASIDVVYSENASRVDAVVKLAFWLGSDRSRCSPAPAVPLENDFRDPELKPRLAPHSDFWIRKQFVDVGVIGNAFAPGGRPVGAMRVGIEIAGRGKHVDVLGNRTVEWSGGRPRITPPEPFVQMPLDCKHAYGGCDFRVPFQPDDPRAAGITLDCDHPGLYPRNPWGRGYIAVADPLEGWHLPNLEDPSDRLTDDRIVANPELWWRQPLPWHLDWVPANCFPRCLYLTIECEPWFPPPDGEALAEVRLGMLPNGYRAVLQDQQLTTPPAWQFRQEAAHGLVLPHPLYGAPLRLFGMHPERPVIECTVPEAPPVLQLLMEHTVQRVEPLLTALAIYPDRQLLTMTYTASLPTPRLFVPGIHKHIPVALSVNGEQPIVYEPPPTIRGQLDAAQKGEQ